MVLKHKPPPRCEECGALVRLVAVFETPGAETETRFYECSNPLCRDTFRFRAPIPRKQEWIGLRKDFGSRGGA